MTSPAKVRANTRRLDRLNIKITTVLAAMRARRSFAHGISLARARVVPEWRPMHSRRHRSDRNQKSKCSRCRRCARN